MKKILSYINIYMITLGFGIALLSLIIHVILEILAELFSVSPVPFITSLIEIMIIYSSFVFFLGSIILGIRGVLTKQNIIDLLIKK